MLALLFNRAVNKPSMSGTVLGAASLPSASVAPSLFAATVTSTATAAVTVGALSVSVGAINVRLE